MAEYRTETVDASVAALRLLKKYTKRADFKWEEVMVLANKAIGMINEDEGAEDEE